MMQQYHLTSSSKQWSTLKAIIINSLIILFHMIYEGITSLYALLTSGIARLIQLLMRFCHTKQLNNQSD